MLIVLLVGVVAPVTLCYLVAKERNRSTTKALIVGFIFGWLGVIIMALFLHKRDPSTGFLK